MSSDGALDLRTGLSIAGWAIAVHYSVALTAVGWSVPHVVGSVCAALATPAVILLATRGPARASRLGLRTPPARFVIAALLIGLTSGFSLEGVHRVFVAPFGPPPATWRGDELGLGPELLLTFIAVLGEELLFRGVLARSLATQWSWPRAVIVSTLAFVAWHHSPYQVVIPLVDGVILGYLALVSGSIVPGLVMHFLHNAVIALEVRDAPAPLWRWVHDHHDSLLGPAALIAFAGVVIATRGEPAT